jgi:hypothetical protein
MTGLFTPCSLTSSHKNSRWELGIANKLDTLYCWVTFKAIKALLLPLIAFNREKGLIIHHTFVDRFYREKVLRSTLL